MKANLKLVSIFLMLFSLGLLAGCSDDDDDNPMTPSPDPDGAQVRVQHLFPAAGGVDVYATPLGSKADPIKVFTNVDFQMSSDFAEVPSGDYKIDVTLTGRPIEEAVLTVPSLGLDEGMDYTAVAWDNGGIAALPLVDDLTAPDAGNIRIRAIHAAAGVGEVDIWNVTDLSNPSPLWVDLGTGMAGDYLEVPAAAYTLGFDLDNDMMVDIFVEVPALPAGSIINAYASLDGSGAFYILAQLQEGTTATVDPSDANLRVVHGAPGVGTVDVWANAGVQLIPNFAYLAGTPATMVAAGTYDIQLTAPGGDPMNPAAEFTGVTLPPADLTAVAYIDGGAQLLGLADDMSAPAAGKFRVRAVHIADGIGQVDIWERTGPAPLWVDLDRGAAGDYLELDAGAYQIGFDINNDQMTDVDFDLPAIAAGEILNVFAINDGGTVFLLAQFMDGTTARIDAN